MVTTKHSCDICNRDYKSPAEAAVCESLGIMPTIPKGTLFGRLKKNNNQKIYQAVLILDVQEEAFKIGEHHADYWCSKYTLRGKERDLTCAYQRGWSTIHLEELSAEDFETACQYFESTKEEMGIERFVRGTKSQINPKNIPTEAFR